MECLDHSRISLVQRKHVRWMEVPFSWLSPGEIIPQ
jgi:hypothetical protein